MNLHLHFPNTFRIHVENAPSSSLTEINQKLATIMSTIADLHAAVTAEDTVIDSAVTLIQGLADKIAALKPEQAAIDALAADVQAKSAALSAAVAANTPADPTTSAA